MQNFIDISNVNINKELPKIDFNVDDGAYELACSIFDICNLRCSFCFQEHTNINQIDMDFLEKDIPKKLFEFMDKEIPKYNITKINLKFWGGELFFDVIPDEFFDSYLKIYNDFVDMIHDKYPDIYIDSTWLSNGIFTNYNRVERLIRDTNGTLGFSYDPVGRFNKSYQIEYFENCVRHFYGLIPIMASITLTKPNINAYLTTTRYDHVIFELNIRTDISYYTPEYYCNENMPSDDDLYNFYKWAFTNCLFNIRAIYDIVSTVFKEEIPYKHYCNCAKAAQYANGKVTKNCALRTSAASPESFYGKFTLEVTEENCAEYKNSLGIVKRDCLNCEFYTCCQKFCWLSIIFDGYKTSDKCPLARIYTDIFNTYDLDIVYTLREEIAGNLWSDDK